MWRPYWPLSTLMSLAMSVGAMVPRKPLPWARMWAVPLMLLFSSEYCRATVCCWVGGMGCPAAPARPWCC